MSSRPFSTPDTWFTASLDGSQRTPLSSLTDLASRKSEGHHWLVAAGDSQIQNRMGNEVFTAHRMDRLEILPRTSGDNFATRWWSLCPAIAVRLEDPLHNFVVMVALSEVEEISKVEASHSNPAHTLWNWLIGRVDSGNPPALGSLLEATPDQSESLPLARLVPDVPAGEFDWLRNHLLRGELLKANHSSPDAIALRAGMLQFHDFLDESHQQSQQIEGQGRTRAGDYWHAIMHRREPDYGNSKYWFRNVGPHPVFPDLAPFASNLLLNCSSPQAEGWRKRLVPSSQWNAPAFVDLCEACADDEEGPLGRIAREIQWREMQLLLKQTFDDASGF